MFCAAPTSTAAYSGVRPMAARDGSRGPENSTREKKITPGRREGGDGGMGQQVGCAGVQTRAPPHARAQLPCTSTQRMHACTPLPLTGDQQHGGGDERGHAPAKAVEDPAGDDHHGEGLGQGGSGKHKDVGSQELSRAARISSIARVHVRMMPQPTFPRGALALRHQCPAPASPIVGSGTHHSASGGGEVTHEGGVVVGVGELRLDLGLPGHLHQVDGDAVRHHLEKLRWGGGRGRSNSE